MRHNPLAMLAGLAAGLVFVSATPAQADVVRLTNGRTMTVDRARFDGETVILLMRGGGEIRAPRSLIEELLPDEEPWARTAALRALANSPTAAAPRPDAETLRAMVDRVARRVGVSPRLAHALVRVESNYNLLAVSHRGAMGLTQIMPAVARTYALRDPYDPEQNLEAGMRHLRRLLAKFPDVRRALAAYNAGETAVSRYGGVPPYRETQVYVQRIMASLQ